MEIKELAFVLKRFFPIKQKVSILCINQGKINIITSPIKRCHQLWPGMLISFDSSSIFKNITFSNNIEILMSPQENLSFNISLIHHFLEICYYFIPLNSPCPEIFLFLYNFFSLLPKLNKIFSTNIVIIEKIYLLKLFQLFGFYQEQEFNYHLELYEQLTSMSIDFKDTQKVESLKRKLKKITDLQINKINDWILGCINNHPCFNLFKTNNLNSLKNI